MLTAVLDRADTALSRFVPETGAGGDQRAPLRGRDGRAALGRGAGEPAHHVGARGDLVREPRGRTSSALTRLVDGDSVVDGFRLDQDMRWSILIKGAAFDLEDAARRLGAEASRDPSDRGDRAAVAGERLMARPCDEGQDVGIASTARATGRTTGPAPRWPASIWRHQRELLAPYRLGFFDRVRDVYRSHDHAFSRSYVRWLVPDRWAEPDVAARVHELVGRLDDSEVLLSRQLREVADDLERAIRVRAVESSATQAPDPA